jgi:hypothetical protein
MGQNSQSPIQLPRQQRRKTERDSKGLPADNPLNPTSAALDLLKYLPHATLASVKQDGHAVWSSLRDDSLIIASNDLVLKHGVNIPGVWHMLGILDALPNSETEADEDAISQAASGSLLGALGDFIGMLGPAIRTMLGRPATSYGMTPILIFRQIGG